LAHSPQPDQNPWQTLSRQLIYENPWINLTEFQVLNPAGKPGIYGVVHFQNQAVGVVPYEAGYIWLVGQYRYPLQRYSWEIPEGGGAYHEPPVEAAKRELREETGLQAAHYEPLLEMHLSNSVSDEWGIVYLATGLTQGEADPEETEELRVRKISLADAYAEVEARQITDSLSVAAIYKLALMQAQGTLP
jgi:8-oxo-dGTP pyrophosphatase MutT (NUDIX family)